MSKYPILDWGTDIWENDENSRIVEEDVYVSSEKEIPVKWAGKKTLQISRVETAIFMSFPAAEKCWEYTSYIWIAVEVLKYKTFSTASDVWAYGVTAWELFSYGSLPYVGMSNNEAAQFVLKGKRMEKPDACPRKMYELMLECWSEDPKSKNRRISDRLLERPNFVEIYNAVDVLYKAYRNGQSPKSSVKNWIITFLMLILLSICPPSQKRKKPTFLPTSKKVWLLRW